MNVFIYPPEGMKIVKCVSCGYPCVQDTNLDGDTCVICSIGGIDGEETY